MYVVRCYVLALVALGGPLKTNMSEFLSFAGGDIGGPADLDRHPTALLEQ